MIGRAHFDPPLLQHPARRTQPSPWGAHVIRAAFAGCGALLLAISVAGCGGGNDYTTRDVPEEYPTIQAAVDAAQPGDLVRIGPGTYREQVVLGPAKRDVVLRGTDRNSIVLDGSAGARSNGITVHAVGRKPMDAAYLIIAAPFLSGPVGVVPNVT